MSNRFRRPAFAAALLAATTLAGATGWQAAMAQDASSAAPHTAPINTANPAAEQLPGFADLVQKVAPAVVTITSTMHEQADTDNGLPFPPGSPQAREFGRFFGMPDGGQQQRVVHALGSGFIIDSQGHIVTNDHVVKAASDIEVTLANGKKLPAKIVGVDPKTDLALLQVKSSEPLPHLALGNSDAARVGDWVVAVGNPFGLGGTVTAGILSARGRHIGEGPYDDFLQVDAPINRGNSGGPLFAQNGTVIGVNTAIYSPSGGSVGIGFAIPSSVVKEVVAQLEAHGKVDRGWLGVAAQSVSPAMATALNLPNDKGALVAQVEDDSPASSAGIKAGDVIERIGDTAVTDPGDLARQVAMLKAGSEHDVTVRRDGQDKTLSVNIAAMPNSGTQQASAAQDGPKLGLALAPLDDQARQQLNLPDSAKGVVIADVKQGSPADNAGLQAGDVVEQVGNQVVTSPSQAVAALKAGTRKPGSAVALRVERNGQSIFVALSAAAPQNAG